MAKIESLDSGNFSETRQPNSWILKPEALEIWLGSVKDLLSYRCLKSKAGVTFIKQARFFSTIRYSGDTEGFIRHRQCVWEVNMTLNGDTIFCKIVRSWLNKYTTMHAISLYSISPTHMTLNSSLLPMDKVSRSWLHFKTVIIHQHLGSNLTNH